MKKHTIYVNIYNMKLRNFDGSMSPDYDGKMAFKTPLAAEQLALICKDRYVRTEERNVSETELDGYILSDEWEVEEGEYE